MRPSLCQGLGLAGTVLNALPLVPSTERKTASGIAFGAPGAEKAENGEVFQRAEEWGSQVSNCYQKNNFGLGRMSLLDMVFFNLSTSVLVCL